MNKLSIRKTNNGWLVVVDGSVKSNGPYVFKATEVLAMVEFIGEIAAEHKVKVERR